MTDADEQYLAHRVRYLPQQLDAARRKVLALENEALRYGMVDLLIDPEQVNAAWDQAINEARHQPERAAA